MAKFRGVIDFIEETIVSGWSVTGEGEPCDVVLFINGERVAEVTSDRARPDLERSGLSKGQGGFRINFGEFLTPGDNYLEIKLPDGTPLTGSPFRKAIEQPGAKTPRYIGFVDQLDRFVLTGWAVDQNGLPCIIDVKANDKNYLVRSDRERPDLARSGHSEGLGGFRIDLSGKLTIGSIHIDILTPDGKHLQGSPLKGRLGAEGTLIVQPSVGRLDQIGEHVAAPSKQQSEEAAPKVATMSEHPKDKKTKSSKPVSLAELDEISLDDLSYAVASGAIAVTSPVAAPTEPPTEIIEEQAPVPKTPVRSAGWLRRLFNRRQ